MPNSRFLRPRIAGRGSLLALIWRAHAALRKALGAGPAVLRLLLVSDGAVYTSEQQFAPIARFGAALRTRLGVVVEHCAPAQARALDSSALRRYAIVGVKLSFKARESEVAQLLDDLASKLRSGGTRLVYFDGDDDLNVAWAAVIERVHLYVKKHLFTDRADYLQPRIGKSNLTDHVARQFGRDFSADGIPTSPGIPEHALSKLALGWNIGLDDKIADLARTIAAPDVDSKTVDVASRAFVKPEVWIYPLRSDVVDRLEEMSSRFKVLAPRDRVSQEVYYEEMLSAKICVSPFGYGELCWRDFEAILCGCLLVKPDMSHAQTWPDIFVPGETYVPVKWDYSNLAEVCGRYLDDPAELQRIARNARQALLAQLTEERFVQRFKDLLERAMAAT